MKWTRNVPRNHPPEKIAHYPPDVRQFLNSLDEKDLDRLRWLLSFDEKKVARFEQWDETLTWLGKTGRFGKALFYIGLALLGAVVTVKTVWDILFTVKGSP